MTAAVGDCRLGWYKEYVGNEISATWINRGEGEKLSTLENQREILCVHTQSSNPEQDYRASTEIKDINRRMSG